MITNYIRITFFSLCFLLTENTFAQYAVQFDDDKAYISYGENSVFDVENITIEAWIKLC